MYQEGSYQSQTAENAPNASMMTLAYSATFGNLGFMVQPATAGEIQAGFPTVPYLSIEALLYNQQMSNPVVATTNISTGSTSGTQNISGSQTVTDNTGNIRVSIGSGSY
jgi:hypothetical protein